MNPPLIDSDVLIDVLRGTSAALRRLTQEAHRFDLFGSVVTRAEVLAGIRPGEEERTGVVLAHIRWLAVDEAVADRAAELSRRHRRAHPSIGIPDYLIAATADLAGLRLLTRNVKHYPMFRRLRPAY